MRIVLDTNVLIAALLTRGACESVVAVCLAQHELLLSEHILAETARILRKKAPAVQQAAVEVLRRHCGLVLPADVGVGACRDPDDLPVLGTAAAAQADYLVTGDQDLLVLGRYGTTRIVSPREFIELIR